MSYDYSLFNIVSLCTYSLILLEEQRGVEELAHTYNIGEGLLNVVYC